MKITWETSKAIVSIDEIPDEAFPEFLKSWYEQLLNQKNKGGEDE